jgi:hypothetical protein
VVLSSVRKHELVFPLKNIVYSSRTDTLANLLKEGYSVHVSFQAHEGEPLLGGTLPHQWVGTLDSVGISTPQLTSERTTCDAMPVGSLLEGQKG